MPTYEYKHVNRLQKWFIKNMFANNKLNAWLDCWQSRHIPWSDDSNGLIAKLLFYQVWDFHARDSLQFHFHTRNALVFFSFLSLMSFVAFVKVRCKWSFIFLWIIFMVRMESLSQGTRVSLNKYACSAVSNLASRLQNCPSLLFLVCINMFMLIWTQSEQQNTCFVVALHR